MPLRLPRIRTLILAVIVLGVGGYFLLDWLIVTDVEHVDATIDVLAEVAERNDVEAVMTHLDESFQMGGLDLRGFRKWYVETLKVLRARNASIYDTTVKIDEADEDLARALVATFVELEDPPGYHRIDWQLEFRRRGENVWKVSSVRAFWPRDGREIPIRDVPKWIP